MNERRSEYTRNVADFSNGTPVMLIARNIGACLLRSNTLSVLVPIRSACIRDELAPIFSKQIAILGYKKEVCTIVSVLEKLFAS